MDAFLRLDAEAARQVEEGAGDAARHVGEDQVGHLVVGLAQAPRDGAQQGRGHLGAHVEPGLQVTVAEAEELHLGQRGRGGGTRARVEERQLTDQLAGAEDRQHVLAPVGGGAVELHLALGDHIEAVTRVTLVEQRVAAREGHLTHRGAELRGLLVIERREKRGAPQNVVHEFSPCRPVQGTVVPIMPDGKTVRSITNQFDARACRGVRQGADWGSTAAGRGRCRRQVLGRTSDRSAGESAGQRG